MIIQNCLKSDEGIIVPVFSSPIKIDKKKISCEAIDIGVLLSIGSIDIPIPEAMIDHMTTHRKVLVYFLDGESYFSEPAAKVEVPQELIFEAKGVYKHLKNNNGQR